MATKYLIDSNVFVQAKNREYQFCFCGGFWAWIADAHSHGLAFTIKKVREEIRQKPDEAKTWCDSLPETFFLEDSGSSGVMANYARFMSWAHATPQYTKAARDQFARADKADAFLLAAALTGGYTIVTHEKSQPAARQRIPIPNAALAFGVPTLTIYELLAMHATPTFVVRP